MTSPTWKAESTRERLQRCRVYLAALGILKHAENVRLRKRIERSK